MQRLQALKAFPLAAAGISVRMLEAGEEFACSDEAAPGLIREKLARPCGLDDDQPFGDPVTTDEVTVGEPGETAIEVPGDEQDGGAVGEDGEAEEASNDAAEGADDEQDDEDDAAEKEAREPIENKDAGDPDGNSTGKRAKRASKGA